MAALVLLALVALLLVRRRRQRSAAAGAKHVGGATQRDVEVGQALEASMSHEAWPPHRHDGPEATEFEMPEINVGGPVG